MYCRNCSNEVSPQAIACPKCGVPPLKGKNFCNNCGIETHPDAIICVGCGVGLQKPTSGDIDTKNIVSIWSKYSYSNYILILLLSAMTFINFKCGGEKVYNITGLNLAVGKDRHYTETKDYGVYGTHDWDRKETIFSWDICAFYLLIITCVAFLITSRHNKFKYARNLSIASLVLLIEWFIATSIKISKADLGAIEASFGMGYWLTLLVNIFSLILLRLHLKEDSKLIIVQQIKSSQQDDNDYRLSKNENPKAETLPVIINRVSQSEPDEVIDFNGYEKKYQEIFSEKKQKTKNKYIIGLGIFILIIVAIYLIANRNSENENISPEATTSIIPRVDTPSTEKILPNLSEQQTNDNTKDKIHNNIVDNTIENENQTNSNYLNYKEISIDTIVNPKSVIRNHNYNKKIGEFIKLKNSEFTFSTDEDKNIILKSKNFDLEMKFITYTKSIEVYTYTVDMKVDLVRDKLKEFRIKFDSENSGLMGDEISNCYAIQLEKLNNGKTRVNYSYECD